MGIDRAVILAAGSGHRIAAVGQTPKPLLPIDGRPGGPCFLDWHLACLAAHGVPEVILVGNHRTLHAPLHVPPGLRVHWVLNPTEDLSRSGSAHSAWFAWNSDLDPLDGRSRVLLMDADILYDPAVLAAFDDPTLGDRSATLVCDEFRDSNEEVMVFGVGRRARVHGKGLLGTSMVAGLEVFGEATGMVLLGPADHALVREVNDWCVRYASAKACSEHEDVTRILMELGRIEAITFGGLAFMECDTPEEYAHLTTDFYARLCASPVVRELLGEASRVLVA